jgi:hypothetical protein
MADLAPLLKRRTAREPGESAVDGASSDESGAPRFLFFFRGKRRDVAAAGTRSKNSGVLEFWFGAAVVVALIAIVVLVFLRMSAAS